MWLLGAGAAASAGIPTAYDLIWRFKRDIFISQRKVSPSTVSDLSDPATRNAIDSHFSISDEYPDPGSPEEYAAFFEAAHPSEKDRRTIIDGMIRNGRVTYGILALALLLKADVTRIIWTTNFDQLIEDACARVFASTSNLTVADLDSPNLAKQAIGTQRWPLLVKLHGDFRSTRLKNTDEELRTQNVDLANAFGTACETSGLIVVGYSGRDHSIMRALHDCLEKPTAYPNGLFWLHYGDGEPSSTILSFLDSAQQSGVEAHWVRIHNFDEILEDLMRLADVPGKEILDEVRGANSYLSAPKLVEGSSRPILPRLNALEITDWPTQCRKVVCGVGGVKDARTAAEAVEADLVITRSKAGVLGFGQDSAFKRAFSKFGIESFDLHSIENRRIGYDSHELGVIRSALLRALARERGLTIANNGASNRLYPSDPKSETWKGLAGITKSIRGNLPKHVDVIWSEGIRLNVEWCDDRFWLLFEPIILFDPFPENLKAQCADFIRERGAQRYNKTLNDLLDFWAEKVSGECLTAFGLGDGVDAQFSIASKTAFSHVVSA